ncbi:hypothetical protein [Propioniciclava flava]
MARSRQITDATLLAHVNKLGEEHPPIRMDSVNFTVNNPDVLRTRFAGVLDYLARVELEVERNVLELLTIMPNPSEADKVFYSDVWYDQEIAHGQILDELKRRIDLPEAEPLLQVGFAVQALGALAKWEPIQDVARTIYYFTGASTERQAVLAYNALSSQLDELGELAVRDTIINQIKRQEPGPLRLLPHECGEDHHRRDAQALAAVLRPASCANTPTNSWGPTTIRSTRRRWAR